MPKPDMLQDLLVLRLLSRRPGLHGYAIMSTFKDSSGDVLHSDEGSLDPALRRTEVLAGFAPNSSRKIAGGERASMN
jgi:PadR family transcriptional regulator PadR